MPSAGWAAADARMVVAISAVSGQGLERLKESLWSAVQEFRDTEAEEEPWSPDDGDDATHPDDRTSSFLDEPAPE